LVVGVRLIALPCRSGVIQLGDSNWQRGGATDN
jgi:hypothetical protein